ncbi:MAG: hypothetical protein MJY93_01525 [Fibrobacter sp.]|nr:hypothetical protein [Fibrobacter sp.]
MSEDVLEEEIEIPKDTLLYRKGRAAFVVGELLMRNKSATIFEGSTDIKFYSRFIENDPEKPTRMCCHAKGRPNVENGISIYRDALEGAKENGYKEGYTGVSFCLDRDYDVFLKKDVIKDQFVHYQMWRKEGDPLAGYNDLEGFLYKTKALASVLKHFGIDAKYARDYRDAMVEACSYIGVFRIANRMIQGEKPSPVLLNNHSGELDVEWFLSNEFIKIDKRSVEIDGENFYDVVSAKILKENILEERVPAITEALIAAKKLLADDFEPGLRYCRGHDLSEVLFALLLKETECESYPSSIGDVETVLYELPPHPSDERNNVLSLVQGYPISKDFDKKIFEEYLQGKR